VQAELRPYQKDGFDFLCHLTQIRLGGILADDMGLGKTLQTLAWLAWLQGANTKNHKPSLVICPASVLHNWRREAERFTPGLKVLVLESGAARHNLRKQIPQHDLIVTNYALLRRDLEELQKFAFRAVILDEAQFIKNPGAQVTQSVKQVQVRAQAGAHRHAAGKPAAGFVEHRGFHPARLSRQPGAVSRDLRTAARRKRAGGTLPRGERIARRRLSAKLRPLLLRRLKKHVAKICPTASRNAATARWATSSANCIWPNCAAAATR
jgi:SNF2 family DNA or RNA helicase